MVITARQEEGSYGSLAFLWPGMHFVDSMQKGKCFLQIGKKRVL